jgi:hypothetical protein
MKIYGKKFEALPATSKVYLAPGLPLPTTLAKDARPLNHHLLRQRPTPS